MSSHPQAASPQDVDASPRRYVSVGKRLVPLSVLIAVAAVAVAAVLAWRLYSPPWAGGIRSAERAPQPPASRVVNAPGPDNTITTLPPPDQRIIAGQKPSEGDKPGTKTGTKPKQESPK
jgi:hypothetical protein